MAVLCPSCGSQFIVTKNNGKKIGASVGLIAGGITGISRATSCTVTGIRISSIAGPTGSAICGVGGAIIGGLLGAASVGSAGAKIGEQFDDNVLDNYECQHCSHTFAKKEALTHSTENHD